MTSIPALVHHTTPERCSEVYTRFPDDTVPVLPFQQTNIRSEMKGNIALSTGSGISFRQVPFVRSFAAIAYKVQGMIAKSLVAYPFMKGSPIVPPFSPIHGVE